MTYAIPYKSFTIYIENKTGRNFISSIDDLDVEYIEIYSDSLNQEIQLLTKYIDEVEKIDKDLIIEYEFKYENVDLGIDIERYLNYTREKRDELLLHIISFEESLYDTIAEKINNSLY